MKRMLDETEFLSPGGIRALSKYYLDNSYYTASLKAEKPITGIDITTLFEKSKTGDVTKIPFKERIYNKASFNVLKYNFNLDENLFTTYLWKEAGIAIVFSPLKYIKSDFNQKNNK